MDFIYEYTKDGLRQQGAYFESIAKDICVYTWHVCGCGLELFCRSVKEHWQKTISGISLDILLFSGSNRIYV